MIHLQTRGHRESETRGNTLSPRPRVSVSPRLTIWAAVLLLSAGCKLKPTYPEAMIASALRHICASEYKLNVETRHAGRSLQAYVYKTALFRGESEDLHGMTPDALKSLQDVLLSSTRIALSTDSKLDFIEIKLADVLTGASLTTWRYVPDITDSIRQRFGEMEYFSRLVVEVKSGVSAKDAARQKLALGQVRWDAPMTLSEFIAKQVIMRAKRDGAERLRAHIDLSNPSTLGVVIENWSSVKREGEEEATKMADAVRKTAQSVIKGYRFAGFRDMVLLDGRGIALQRWAF